MSEPVQFTIILWIIWFCSDKGVGSNLIDEKLSNLTDPKLSIWLFCKNPLPTSLIERLFFNESTVAMKIKSPLFILIIVMCGNSFRYIVFFLIGCSELRIELIQLADFNRSLRDMFFMDSTKFRNYQVFVLWIGNSRNRQATRPVVT